MSLNLINGLLQEFYQQTSTERRREIENQLIAFKQQANFSTLQSCLKEAINFENNQFLWFFCTACLSHAITRRWSQLSVQERTFIRDTLWTTYANLPVNNNARRQRDTIAQLIAQIGKREFPDDHNYFSHLLELLKTRFLAGIVLLRVTTEECNREDLPTNRKSYFNSCANVYIPQIMDLETNYLLIAVCHVNNKNIYTTLNSFALNLAPTLPNDSNFSCSLMELLQCAQHTIAWTLMNTDLISDLFLMSILDLAKYREELSEHSLVALSVINEILYLQKPLPSATTLITGIYNLLQHHNAVKPHNEMYIDKFRELLRVFILKYWSKMLHEVWILFEGFLHALFLCTLQRHGALDFTEKLEIWHPIVKGLKANDKLNQYNGVLKQLAAEIMQRIQFENNKLELELLDNESGDDNAQTEWQQYLTQCIELIALIAEICPAAVFAQVSGNWTRVHTFLIGFEHDIENGKNVELARKLINSNCSENLKDFATICQAVARIAPLVETTDSGCQTQLEKCTENLFTVLQLFTRNKISQIDVNKTTFQTDYYYLFAQILMAIRTFLTLPIVAKNKHLLPALLTELGRIFQPGTAFSPIVYMAASQLLLSISTVIRSKSLVETPAIMSLMQAGPSLAHLPAQVIPNVYITFISYLVLPWKNVENGEQQDFSHRCVVLREYVTCLAHNLLELEIEKIENVPASILAEISHFSEVLKFFNDASNSSKDMLAVSFKPTITKTMMLFNSFGSDNNVANAITDLSLSALRTFCFAHLGTQFIQSMIELFINVGSREKLSLANLAASEKVLQMFQTIVEQPGNGSVTMLPSILDYSIHHILPLMHQNDFTANSCNIANIFYTLVDSILNNKWQYFYKSNIQLNGSLSAPSGGDNLHPEHFNALLMAYGQVLVSSSDPNIVRQVLQSMLKINERWRLYQRPLFKDNLLTSFQAALINMLLSDQGALHFELLATSLFAMGQVDTLKLREGFMTAQFPVIMNTIDEICLSTDIPTFSQKLTRLIQDVHCVHLT